MQSETISTDALTRLYDSTSDFFLRFLGKYPPAKAQLRVASEELFELTEAALDYSSHCTSYNESVAEEAVDLIVTALGVCMACGVTREQIEQAAEAVAQKNDAKTLDTHYVNSAGKIARR